MITDADLARWEALCAAVERGEVRLRPTRREDGGSLAALTAALPALLAEVRRLRALCADFDLYDSVDEAGAGMTLDEAFDYFTAAPEPHLCQCRAFHKPHYHGQALTCTTTGTDEEPPA